MLPGARCQVTRRVATACIWAFLRKVGQLSRAERLALVDRADPDVPLTVQAEQLGLNRTSLQYQPVPAPAQEVTITHAIDDISTENPSYGSRRIGVLLARDDDLAVNRKAVQRPMREMGSAGICPGPNLSKRHPDHRVYPYLLRGVTATAPNHIWAIDITSMRLTRSWMYLVAVLDLYARSVVSWALDDTMAEAFVLDAVDRALAQATPHIWKSDQGSQFTSSQQTSRLEAAGVRISMDGRGRAFDTIFVERLWRTVTYEDIYLHDYAHPRAVRTGLSQFFRHDNEQRPHMALEYATPATIYVGAGAVPHGDAVPLPTADAPGSLP